MADATQVEDPTNVPPEQSPIDPVPDGAIAFDPGGTFEIVMADDVKKSKPDQRVLLCSVLSARQETRLEDRLEAFYANRTRTSVDALAESRDIIASVIVGWRNFKDDEGYSIPYAPGGPALRGVLTRGETIEIRDTLLSEMSLGFLSRRTSA